MKSFLSWSILLEMGIGLIAIILTGKNIEKGVFFWNPVNPMIKKTEVLKFSMTRSFFFMHEISIDNKKNCISDAFIIRKLFKK